MSLRYESASEPLHIINFIGGQGTAKPKASGDDLLYRGTPLDPDRGVLLIRNAHPHRITICPWA